MRKIKKLSALMLAVVMALAMSITAFAQTVTLDPADEDGAKITINNAAKGETYSIYKLFDATVGENGEIAYQCPGEIPSGLTTFFSKDNKNNVVPDDSILVKDEGGKVTGTNMTEGLKNALETWAKSVAATNSAVSDGSVLEFTGLPYGYYVMTTTQIDKDTAKAAITVTSTQPNASIYDKNTNKPSAKKTVEKESYSIGDTITYTATFDTTNYIEGVDDKGNKIGPKQVVNYVISDTLPEFLDSVTVTSIMIGDQEYKPGGTVPQFDNKNEITIPWATGSKNNYTNIYNQGTQIVMTYTAVLTSTTNINAADTNTVSIRPSVDNGGDTPDPWNEHWDADAKITTYAAAIHKVDEEGKALAGAEFTIAGLKVEAVENETGVYRVVSYKPNDSTQSAQMSTDANGKLYIVGLASDVKLAVTEAKAPDGYNKLTNTVELTPKVLTETIYETSGDRYYDEKGNLVSESSDTTTTVTVENNLSELKGEGVLEIENSKGTLLPSTGGIGTTIFYIIGGILVIGAGIILVVKKRASHE